MTDVNQDDVKGLVMEARHLVETHSRFLTDDHQSFMALAIIVESLLKTLTREQFELVKDKMWEMYK
jgi:hypothetical protein